jgi:hypothetical protein
LPKAKYDDENCLSASKLGDQPHLPELKPISIRRNNGLKNPFDDRSNLFSIDNSKISSLSTPSSRNNSVKKNKLAAA